MPTSTSSTISLSAYFRQDFFSTSVWPPTFNDNADYVGALMNRTLTGTTYRHYHAGLQFNTSSLPSNATITSAQLSITPSGTPTNYSGRYLVGDWGTYDVYTGVTVPQGGAIGTQGSAASTGTALTGTTMVVTLSNAAANINKLGYTNLRLWMAEATSILGSSAGTAPSSVANEQWNITTASATLTVYYNIPSTTTVSLTGSLGLSGVLARSVAGFKAFTGSLGLSGTLFKIKPTIQPLTATLGLSGNLIQGIGRYTPVEASLRIATKYSNKLLAVTKQLLSLRIKPR